MTQSFSDLMSCLDLTRTGEAEFRGHNVDLPMRRLFGGQVAAQALVAAGRTIPADGPDGTVDRLPHSLHAYFLRAGRPDTDVEFTVHLTRDGGSFSNRHVEARQGNTVIFQLVTSFAREQDGPDHRPAAPEVPAPDTLTDTPTHRGVATGDQRFGSLEIRAVPHPAPPGEADDEPRMYWRRASEKMPDDPLLHAAVLTFASDLGTVSAIIRRHRAPEGVSRHEVYDGASLDHTIWFHRRFRADDWMLFTSASPSASSGRGLMLGEVYDPAGLHVASIAQEGMVRTRRRR